MITMICGLIGAGKSTYALKHFANVTDLDAMRGLTKSDQIRQTMKLHDSGEDVAHITCFPTIEEEVMLKNIPRDEIRFIWIDTPPIQCRKNIIQRGRLRDTQDLGRVLALNAEYYTRLSSSRIKFNRVHLFDDDERW